MNMLQYATTKELRSFDTFESAQQQTHRFLVDGQRLRVGKSRRHAVGLPVGCFRTFRVVILQTVGLVGGGVQIGGAMSVDGTGFVPVAQGLADTTNPVGLWCTIDKVQELLPSATHVVVIIDAVSHTDEFCVMFERADPFYGPHHGLTADYVS